MDSPVGLDEHLETLRIQARFTLGVLRKTADMLERALAGDRIDPHQIDQLRSQSRAGLRSLRTTNQLFAQAAALIAQPQEAQHDHQDRKPARVG